MKSLIELVQESTALEQLLYESDGIITDEQTDSIITQWITEITSGIAVKADGYQFKMDSLESQATRLKDNAKKLTNTARSLENLAARLKDRLKSAMIQMNKLELEGNMYKYKLSSSATSIHIDDELKVPAIYTQIKTIVEIDKKLLKETIENGTEIAGVTLEKGFTLRTSVKK